MSETIETPVPADEGLPDTPSAPKENPAPKAEPKPSTIALATFEDLEEKAPREDPNYVLNLPQSDGTSKQVRLHMRAIDGPAYDKLISKCPPTREQAGRGMAFNPDVFEPLLVSEVVVEPKFPAERWAKVRTLPNWSGGEWASLALRAQALCMQGLDVPFSASG